jgi:hypothetical protein
MACIFSETVTLLYPSKATMHKTTVYHWKTESVICGNHGYGFEWTGVLTPTVLRVFASIMPKFVFLI